MAQLRVSLVHSTTPAHGSADVYAIALLHWDGKRNRVAGDPSRMRYLLHEMTTVPRKPTCRYCGEVVPQAGYVHAGGCGNVG